MILLRTAAHNLLSDEEEFIWIFLHIEDKAEYVLKQHHLDDFLSVAFRDCWIINLVKSLSCDGNESIKEHDNIYDGRERENNEIYVIIPH